jgi:ABC-2 type transport system permease protein
MKYSFFNTCLAEIKKQHKNYYNSWSSFISLLIWPALICFTSYYVYLSFDLNQLVQYGLETKEQLMIFLIIGALGYNSFFSMIQGAFQITNERQNGTLEIIYATPANRLAMLYGRALGGFLQSVWMFSVFFVTVVLYNSEVTFSKIISLMLSYLIMTIASIIWGGFINILFIITRDASFLFTICDEPMNFFSGVKIPLLAFPIWAQIISSIFPLTYCLLIMRRIIIKGSIFNNLEDLFKLFASLLILVFLTHILSVLAEKHNRETGNLQLY